MHHPGHRGIPLALASAALFGASTPFAKLLLGALDPWLVAGLLYLGAGLGLAAVHLTRTVLGLPTAEAPLRRSDLPRLAAVVAAGGMAGPVLLMLGLARVEATSASLLLNLEALATMAIAWIVFRENVDRRLLLGAAAILAGAVVLSWQGGTIAFAPGAFLIAAACLAWGIDNNLTRGLSSVDPVQIAAIKGLVAGAVNTVLALSAGAALPGVGTVALSGLVGFLGYGVSLVMFVLALRHLGSARTGAYFSLAPFVGAIIAIGLLGEPLTLRLAVAALLIAVGLWLHLAERHEHDHAHEYLVHDHAHRHDEHHRHDHGDADPPTQPHAHLHRHAPLRHRHPHYPDLHHRHGHR